MFGIENQQDRSITSGRKSGLRSSHIAALVSEPDSEVPGSNPGRGKSFFVIMNVFSYALRVTVFIWELKRYFQGNNQLSLNINRRFKNLVQELTRLH